MALLHMSLRDFVIVRALDLDMRSGFSVLTGETGAGKSILIDALQLVLGARADVQVVREGASRCEVSAEFTQPPGLLDWLQDQGFESGETLLLRRTVDAAGKSRAFVNGSAATATQLRELADHLVDIHGQHAWQSLTRPASVRELLDAYAGLDLKPLRNAWQVWREALQVLDQARTAQDSLATERERLNWQIGELARLDPREGQWGELNEQHQRLSNAQALIDAAQRAGQQINGDEGGDALGAVSRALSALQDLVAVEPQFQPWCDVLMSAQAQLEDVGHSLHAYWRRTELDPQGLSQLDEQLGQWLSLSRRFRRPPEELPALLAQWQQELHTLEQSTDLEALQTAATQAEAAYQAQARQVSRQRRQAAPRLAQSVTQAMQQLGMQGGRFEVALQTCEPALHGLEDVVFLAAGHAGSTPRPVAKVASGGELSRMALAIAVTTSELGQAGTLIFDEVDSGVGGAVAETVGRLMRQLGRHRQVLAVTHLPQVAACADHHFWVSKGQHEGRVSSQVEAIEGEARVQEIARMLGGEKRSATTVAHAREMLEASAEKP